jgi:hypothetical protein
LGAFCSMFRARPVGARLGAKFGRKPAQTQNNNYNLYIDILNEGTTVQPLSRSVSGHWLATLSWSRRAPRAPDPSIMRFGHIHGPKQCKFIWFGDINRPKPYKFIGFGDIHGSRPYEFIRFCHIHGPKRYKFRGFVVAASLRLRRAPA